MAQDFVGSNNIPWLVPQGQFGTRLQGGKDSASPRYIHTYLQPGIRRILPDADLPVLTYRDDDGLPVEPEWYAPVLPMLLVNGTRGIGTGYSTYIPSYNPRQLRTMLMSWLEGDAEALDEELTPYFQGFKGEVKNDGTAVGVYRKEKDEFVVSELPPGTWTSDYREWLEKELAEGRIKEFTDTSTDTDVTIRIKGIEEAALVKSLTTKLKTSNMHAFNSKCIITKYDTPNDILKEYATVRLELYETRRRYQIQALKQELPYHTYVMKFIEDQISDSPTIVLKKKPMAECETILTKQSYPKIESSYDYIMKLPVSAFTAEQIAKHNEKLKKLTDEIKALEQTTARELWKVDLHSI
jgi:DNA topoisomerase-2